MSLSIKKDAKAAKRRPHGLTMTPAQSQRPSLRASAPGCSLSQRKEFQDHREFSFKNNHPDASSQSHFHAQSSACSGQDSTSLPRRWAGPGVRAGPGGRGPGGAGPGGGLVGGAWGRAGGGGAGPGVLSGAGLRSPRWERAVLMSKAKCVFPRGLEMPLLSEVRTICLPCFL